MRLTIRLTVLAAATAAAIGLAGPTPAGAATAPGILTSQDLASAGVGSPYYRIPALATSTAGTLLAAYDARPTLADLPSHISIVLRRSTDGGTSWQDQQIVRTDPVPQGYGDPSLIVDRQTGRIFVFYAAGVNTGFGTSVTGNDENNPNILQADYSYSDDDGLTWHHRRITSEIKDPSWGGLFAASGEGIQIQRGPYAGRLVQQYTIRIAGQNWAASAYSDDHGATWQMGQPVGPGMDENKSVELADGRLMLNSRATPYRKLAYSSDGGQTWTGLHADPNLIDPNDNGSIIRYDAVAGPASPRSHWLLFSNNESTTSRSNLVIKMSCDDGQTWPIRKVVEPGVAAYSTLTALDKDRFGLLWERENYTKITYSSFDRDWLGGVCAPITVGDPGPLQAGATTNVAVTVGSQEPGSVAQGQLSLQLPAGWRAPTVAMPKLGSGETATVQVPVTVPAGTTTNAYPWTAVLTTNKGIAQAQGSFVVLGGAVAWSDSTRQAFDGTQITDVSDQVTNVKDLTGGAVRVRFSTTSAAPAAVLLSSADPVSQVRDLVLSVNSGTPYAEVRTATSSYPVRLASSVRVDDGKEHELIFATSHGTSSLILDGKAVATAPSSGFFGTVTALTKPYPGLNPSGLPNLTLGSNRAYVSSSGGTTNRWFFTGTISSVEVRSAG
jgi:sialidase-1